MYVQVVDIQDVRKKKVKNMKIEKLIEILKDFPLEFEIETAVSPNKYVVMIPKHPNDLNFDDGVLVGNLKSKQQLLRELEIVNSVVPDVLELPDGSEQLVTNPNGDINLLEIPDSLKDYMQVMVNQPVSLEDVENYKICLVPMMFNIENLEKVKNFEIFMEKYKNKILNKEIVIPYFIDTGSLFDDYEYLIVHRHSSIEVIVGIKDHKDNLQDFVDIYNKYFEQFPNKKHFNFNENLELGYLTFDEID